MSVRGAVRLCSMRLQREPRREPPEVSPFAAAGSWSLGLAEPACRHSGGHKQLGRDSELVADERERAPDLGCGVGRCVHQHRAVHSESGGWKAGCVARDWANRIQPSGLPGVAEVASPAPGRQGALWKYPFHNNFTYLGRPPI